MSTDSRVEPTGGAMKQGELQLVKLVDSKKISIEEGNDFLMKHFSGEPT